MLKICKAMLLHVLFIHRPNALWMQKQSSVHIVGLIQQRHFTQQNMMHTVLPPFSVTFCHHHICQIFVRVEVHRPSADICSLRAVEYLRDISGRRIWQFPAAVCIICTSSSYKSFPWREASSIQIIVSFNTVSSL